MRHETILIVESEELQHTTVEIDKLSNTVIYTTDTSATANTLLLDKILTLQDSKQEFNALVAEDIAQELIGGFNSSVISIKAASVIGQSDDLLNAIVGLLTQRNSGDEVPSLAISVYEIYGDAFRDLIDPNAALVLTSTYKGDVLDGLTTVPIATPFDLLNVLTRVHGSMSSDIDKTWNIYEIFVLQAEVESTLRIVETCSPRYSAMEKSKLILSEGMLMAESMVSFYEILNNPAAVYSTNLTVARLLEREVGGNTSVRWIAGLSESELESSVCLWLFRMLEMARQVDNIPVTNTRFVIENQKRIWVIFNV